MGRLSLSDEIPNLAYRLGDLFVSNPPRHIDVSRSDGRTHAHVVGSTWEIRVSWHRLDN